MWVLTVLFLLRVLGQAIQYWLPQPGLPPFASFQGSDLPYWVLLPSQLVILGLMCLTSWRVQAGIGAPRHATGRVLAWLGGFYMAVSIGRLVIGLSVEGVADWFTAWIPAALHVVLAAFVLCLAYHYVGEPKGGRAA
jgi:hypothetical protein